MLHDSMLYDVAGGHITLHIVVFDVEDPRKMSESTSYLTQLSKAKAHTFHDYKKAYLATLLNKEYHKEYRQLTRWWSHQKALENVFFGQKGKLFECFIDTLDECQSVYQSRETITDAEALEIKLTSFEGVLTAHVFNQIFSITDPASLYLQSGKIDLLTAIRLIETAESQLEKLRGEFSQVLSLAKTFCVDHELEQDFASKRTKKKKRLPDELSNDEIEEDPISRYRRETFVYAIDTAIMSMRDRFSSQKAILADSALLDPERFQDINSSNSLPPDAFENVARNYGFDEGKLQAEYISFIEIYPKLREPKDDRPFNETSPGPSDDINRENFIALLKVQSTFNVQSAFPELYTVYKILVTLPIGSTKCERTFSKLKFVKNNLRSTMGQKQLNSLMLINVERDLTKVLDYEQVINSFADTQLLQNMLRY